MIYFPTFTYQEFNHEYIHVGKYIPFVTWESLIWLAVSNDIFSFHLEKLGKMNPIWLAHIFQMGGKLNHQPVMA